MQTLALQTDSRGVTAVLVERPKSGDARLLGVATVELAAAPKTLAEALIAALPKLRGGKPQVVVALGPEEARVRRLSVPPAPAEELPTLVAMQAAREATVEADDLVADFLPPTGESEGPLALLSTWAKAERVEFWGEVAEALGGKLSVAAPRPLATTTLVRGDEAGGARLVATQAGDAIDYAATAHGAPTLLRSTHVGDSTAAQRELRRTLLSLSAAEGAAPSVSVSSTDLSSEATPVAWSELAAELGGSDDSTAALEDASAAVGLALATLRGEVSPLNLADPRKPPVAETGRRRQLLLAATTGVVLLAGAWMAYQRVADLDRQIDEKEREIAAARDEVEAFDPYRERVASLDAWRSSDVTWLDEIDRLSQKLRPQPLDAEEFPADNDIRASQIVATAYVGGDEPGGRIDLTAAARDSSTSDLETRLRDEDHPVEPISTAEAPAADAYRYKYSVLLRVPAEADPADDSSEEEASP